ncbi:MAG: lysophospholipid acyltransferase family protein [Desulfobacula sp.]
MDIKTVMENTEYQKYRRYGIYIYRILRLLMMTLDLKIHGMNKIDENENFIYVCWHQKLFFPTVGFRHIKKKIGLVSPSKDGEILAAVLEKYGFEVIRGSSNDKNIQSLIRMIKRLKQGYNLGLAADGPQGPACRVKPGIVYMAAKTGKKIIPMGGAFRHKHVFEKAWDRFHFPYPFTRAVVVVGDPITVPGDANPEDYIIKINQAINRADEEAEALLKA